MFLSFFSCFKDRMLWLIFIIIITLLLIILFFLLLLLKVHAILRDNASNMKKAMRDLGVSSLGCFSHMIQLVVHDGLLSQRSVSDALASGRKIIGHFKHSPLATSRLETVQTGLGMPVKRLIQDVPTRWNSTFYI